MQENTDFQNAAGLLALDTLMEAFVRNQGYVDLDEFLDSKPYITRPERHMHLTMKCTSCGRGISDDYARQNPDFLAWHKCCHWCMADVIAVDIVPFTIFFHSHSSKHASFSDDVSGQCWQCGHTHQLRQLTLQGGLTIELCLNHWKHYQLHQARMSAGEEEKRANIAIMKREAKHLQPYTCSECGKALSFPEAFFVDGLTYCAGCSPDLSKDSQGW